MALLVGIAAATRLIANAQGQEFSSFEQILTRPMATVGGQLATRIPDLYMEGVLEAEGSSGRFLFAWLAPDNFPFGYELSGQRHQQVWTRNGSWSVRDGAVHSLDVQEIFLAPWLFALAAPRRSARVVEQGESGRLIEARGPFGRWVLRDLQYRLAGGVSSDLFVRPGTPVDTAWRDAWLAPADFEIALTEAQRRFAEEPFSLDAATALATAALGAGAWDEFLRALDAAERFGGEAPAVLALRGRRLLWEHRIAEAVPVLRAAVAAKATGAVEDLATALYHAGQLAEAGQLYRKAGVRREGFARMLEAAGDAAYTLRWPESVAEVVVPFIQADPLPVVEVTVNGRRRTFFIDTGAAIVYLAADGQAPGDRAA